MRAFRRILPLLAAFVAACSPTATPPRTAVAPVPHWDATPKEELPWLAFDANLFARAKAENKFVIMDGSAEWCHWCHVMEAVTYHDPEIRKIIDAHFLAAKVDVDARPDVEERYSDYGWPATVIFAPDATELGKYKGFLDPATFKDILNEVVLAGPGAGSKPAAEEPAIPDAPLPEEQLVWIARMTSLLLDERWDEEQGSWGHEQKVPLFYDNAWSLARGRAGGDVAKKRALFSLEKQLDIIDPVWGGIYQYSTDGDWKHAHFEKLMYFNAGALENYADAAKLTGDARFVKAAAAIKGYLDRFLSSPEGGFYTTQDADLNAHEQGKTFLTGHEYYAKNERERLALGIPRIDTHEYPRDNGLAIHAYCTYAKWLGDAGAIARAAKAADHIVAAHERKDGLLAHEADKEATVAHLADNAAFAWGLIALVDAGQKERLPKALALVDTILQSMEEAKAGGFYAHTEDKGAVGIFAIRRKPFEDNVVMLRVLAELERKSPDHAARYGRAIDRTLRAIATPDKITERGRFLGDFLLALDETKDVRGRSLK
ncbi:hypothetical protein BH09MYX1_BH09MYX1_21840 [soil metagenome]